MTTSVKFTIGGIEILSQWRDTETARKLLAALPFSASGSYWGGEFYFSAPVRAACEKDACEVVEPGTVAFWVDGSCLCIFWGPTPASQGQECRAASNVNIVGKVTNPEVLPGLKGRQVLVEKA
jgi:hypothetical protein